MTQISGPKILPILFLLFCKQKFNETILARKQLTYFLSPLSRIPPIIRAGFEQSALMKRPKQGRSRSMSHPHSKKVCQGKTDDNASMGETSQGSSRPGNQSRGSSGAYDKTRTRRTSANSTTISSNGSNGSTSGYKKVLAKRGYLTMKTLGSGSYSKVKVALDTGRKYGDRVAVKMIDRTKASRDYLSRFLCRELAIWPTLHHPHITSLFEHFEDDRRIYMICEYAPGGDTLYYIKKHGAMREKEARRWIMQVTDAVMYMHDLGITHRDLKLENLVIDSKGNLKICDFGFTKGSCAEDLSKTFCGSKAYAAPEILQGKPYDPRKADVWAIGVILFILTTGTMPFHESKGTKVLLEEQRLLALEWPPNLEVTHECRAVVFASLEWDFRRRPDIYTITSFPWFGNKGAPRRMSGAGRPISVTDRD